jgi:cysteinyl-tRNA synthetase
MPSPNARPAVVFDVLFRLLKHRFGNVLYVRNVTDIGDKIMAAAEAEGVATEVIARRYAAAYHEDMAALNVLPPTVEPYEGDRRRRGQPSECPVISRAPRSKVR